MKKVIPLILVMLLAVAFLTGCGNDAPAQPGQTGQPAQTGQAEQAGQPAQTGQAEQPAQTESATRPQDMELVIFGSAEEPMVAAVAQAFERETGIRTMFLRLSTGEVYTRIREEGGNPSADVWFARRYRQGSL